MLSTLEKSAAQYAAIGVDAKKAIRILKNIPVSIHCWQGDDVRGFDRENSVLDGGIQTTGSYPGRARTFDELTSDFAFAMRFIPGKKRLNLHANYAIFNGPVHPDRDAIAPEHFSAWADWADSHGLAGIDFNPTLFSHPLADSGLTLSNPDSAIRDFWVAHCIACRVISASFAKRFGESLCNVWIPDGYKNAPADRLGPRMRLSESLDRIFANPLSGVVDSVESKVFGIGLESCTVGSNEFYLAYAARHKGVYPLLDNGHFHPTELVSDKISALLCSFDRLPLHLTHPVRWDSDHVVQFDDELCAIAAELVRCNALEKALIGLDFFDASINRTAAWVLGARNVRKALLYALLMPHAQMKELQDANDFTALMALNDSMRTLPFGDVWDAFCEEEGVPDDTRWFSEIQKYERDVLLKRK